MGAHTLLRVKFPLNLDALCFVLMPSVLFSFVSWFNQVYLIWCCLVIVALCMSCPQRACLHEDAVRADIRAFVHLYSTEHSLTGRSIARVFHGIGSPNFPVDVWGRVRRFWRCHLKVDFNVLRRFATQELVNMRWCGSPLVTSVVAMVTAVKTSCWIIWLNVFKWCGVFVARSSASTIDVVAISVPLTEPVELHMWLYFVHDDNMNYNNADQWD